MDVSGYHHSDSITIDAPPAEVYAIISDVTRIGDLSPVCKSAVWDDAGQTKVSYVSPETIAGRYGLDPALAANLAAIGPLTDALVAP